MTSTFVSSTSFNIHINEKEKREFFVVSEKSFFQVDEIQLLCIVNDCQNSIQGFKKQFKLTLSLSKQLLESLFFFLVLCFFFWMIQDKKLTNIHLILIVYINFQRIIDFHLLSSYWSYYCVNLYVSVFIYIIQFDATIESYCIYKSLSYWWFNDDDIYERLFPCDRFVIFFFCIFILEYKKKKERNVK